MTTLKPPPLQDFPSSPSAHTLPEAMHPFAASRFRLVRSFWHRNLQVCRRLYGDRGGGVNAGGGSVLGISATLLSFTIGASTGFALLQYMQFAIVNIVRNLSWVMG